MYQVIHINQTLLHCGRYYVNGPPQIHFPPFSTSGWSDHRYWLVFSVREVKNLLYRCREEPLTLIPNSSPFRHGTVCMLPTEPAFARVVSYHDAISFNSWYLTASEWNQLNYLFYTSGTADLQTFKRKITYSQVITGEIFSVNGNLSIFIAENQKNGVWFQWVSDKKGVSETEISF